MEGTDREPIFTNSEDNRRVVVKAGKYEGAEEAESVPQEKADLTLSLRQGESERWLQV